MNTHLYTFYDLPYGHDVCHLFEHILLDNFMAILKENGYERATFGWLDGETVGSSLFFNLCTYDTQSLALFESTLSNPLEIDEAVIQRCLRHISAEMKARITVTDMELLKEQLRDISAHMQSKTAPHTTEIDSPLRITPAKGSFKGIAIILDLTDADTDLKKSFLFFRDSILDIVKDALPQDIAMYATATSPFDAHLNHLMTAQRYTVSKDVSIDELQASIENRIRTYAHKEINSIRLTPFLDAFKERAWLNGAIANFYKNTGIQTTHDELVHLASAETLQAILQKLTVKVLPVKGRLKHIWGE